MQDKLIILWTSDNVITAENMVLMYALNGKMRHWWTDIKLIIWGGSSALVRDNEKIQVMLEKLLEVGVEVEACKACADNIGSTEILEKLGIKVRYMGEPLTEYLKLDYKMITI